MDLTYIKETHRTRGVIDEAVLCPQHFAEQPAHRQQSHGYDKSGYKLEVRPWTGPARECSFCDLAEELREK